jgi:aminoacyl tRNA synthase complex-interacting multifunctional protein 1
MSFQAAIAKLSIPVKELVISVTENGIRHIGESAKDQAEVTEWIEKAGQPDVVSEANLQVCRICRFAGDSAADDHFPSRASTLYSSLEPTSSTIT